MATMTETSELDKQTLQVRPEPLRLRSGNRRNGIVVAPVPSRAQSFQDQEPGLEKDEQRLPPTDGGAGAWKFLFGAFIVEALMFGKS